MSAMSRSAIMITKSLRLNLKLVYQLTHRMIRPVEMSSLEQCFDRNERLHSVIIPDHGLFAPEPLKVR
jgi:hypothetical protein